MTQQPNGRVPIEVLLFDVGGVLCLPPDVDAVAAVEAALRLPAGGLSPFLYDGNPWETLSIGGMDEDDYWRILAGRLAIDPGYLQSLARPVWGPANRYGADMAVVDLARAAARKARLAILSNATLELEAHLAEHGIAALFDPILNSARIGLRKPDPRCFHYALDVLEAPASAVLFIDDKPRNTRVAGVLGMHCHDFIDAATLAEALACLGLLP